MKIKYKIVVTLLIVLLQSQYIICQSKVINYDYETGSFDRNYLYFRQNFIIKGNAKFNNLTFDSVRVYIYKTRADDANQINKVLLRPVSYSIGGGTGRQIITKHNLLYFGDTDDPLNSSEIAGLAAANPNEVVDELTFSGRWIRPNKDASIFSIAINQQLSFNWKYAVKFVISPSVTGTVAVASGPTTKVVVNGATSLAVDIAAGRKELNTVDPVTGVKSVTTIATSVNRTNAADADVSTTINSTLQSIPQNTIETGPDFLLAYDDETVQSRFSVSTGLGGIFFRSKEGKSDGEFLNYVGVKFHFKRVFPTLDNPFFLGQASRFSVGFGLVTTTLKYRESQLLGFGEKATAKPLVFLSYNFHKHFGISSGIVTFKQESGISTNNKKTIAVAPFLTIHVSADVVGLFKSASTPPPANSNPN